MFELLDYPFMQRALLAALLIGVAAPAVGIYLVQRRQALMGDGIGHVALTGVALGFLFESSPVWTAVAVSALGAVGMELLRASGRARGDIALAMLFYGGMAGGVMIINLAPGGSTANLTSYLWGSVTTVSPDDITAITLLSAFVVLVALGLRRQLFAVCQDEEFARVTGLPVRALNLLLAVTAAATVTVAMRVVGLLLVSALMVIPVVAAQQVTRGFATTLAAALTIGVLVSVSGTATSYYQDVPPGATIVLLAIGVFVLAALLAVPLARLRTRRARAATPGTPPGSPPGSPPDAGSDPDPALTARP
ncbi:metal ABC transporter permease [Streptomyces radicis]|uniref:Metal ABC transporter permease n=1 Tax=Streptomyces radicis TaxID=1750517 RepID=A0A3A9WF53_9ACTN|nr:metal ABC transporter permease [Streptomyces radicis]RKN11941.1 metal ABC transporter permease [Streptomyces radicis]RKN26008.1 metal ABC transporter permease [Streptomyces radicis]